jgi:hypothetical protein
MLAAAPPAMRMRVATVLTGPDLDPGWAGRGRDHGRGARRWDRPGGAESEGGGGLQWSRIPLSC